MHTGFLPVLAVGLVLHATLYFRWLLATPALVLEGLSPVMLVHGTADPLIPPPVEAVWNYVTQDKENLCVPIPLNAGHFPMYEYDAFPRLLNGFLDEPDISKLEIKERWRRRSR